MSLENSTNAVAAANGYAYVSTKNALLTFDLTEPTAPRRSATVPLLDSVWETLYIAGGSSGLYLLELTNPVQPTPAVLFTVAGMVLDVTVNGAYAYLADGAGGLRILLVKDERHPVQASEYLTLGRVWNVADSKSCLQIGAPPCRFPGDR